MEIIRRIVNSVPTANQLEHDLRDIWNEMEVQSNIAATVRNQLQHETTDESWSTAGAGERTLLLNRILSTANSAKESFLRLGAMYALTDRMYDQQMFSGCIGRDRRDQWLRYREGEFSASWVMRALNTEMEKLSSTIELTSELLAVAKKELREQESMFSCFRGSLHKSERAESKAVSRVTEMLEKQQDIIRNIRATVCRAQMVELQSSEFSRRIASGDSETGDPSSGDGTGYEQLSLSYYCLNQSKDKLCFYCKHPLGTVFQDEIPDDEGHHRAICPVPEKKGLMKGRIHRLKERLRQLKKEEETFPRGECRDKTT
ncbi:unnamed protein product [Heligmosomoides polygyrus]|uniref:Helo_like_N domain-containing protein n=1 Tax=Heligmosomoides polygyrus TaxID=6339 RepID=A0A183FPW2_HELPZ|nr:unnamed protein product [Heligmosomoides polygyrus]